MLMQLNISAGHRKFTLISAKLQELFRNRKSASLQSVCGNFSHFRNRKCTLHFRKLRPQYSLLLCPQDELFLEVKFCRRTDVDLQTKKVINTRTLTSNPENKSVHFFQAALSRNRQHCLLFCEFAVNFNFFTTNICGGK